MFYIMAKVIHVAGELVNLKTRTKTNNNYSLVPQVHRHTYMSNNLNFTK